MPESVCSWRRWVPDQALEARRAGREVGREERRQEASTSAEGPQLTSTLLSHCRTDRKDCLAVRSYMTMTPSAFRKNCWVMQRYLHGGAGQGCGRLSGERGRHVSWGQLLTSPARLCPTAAGPPESHPHAPSSHGNRCLQGRAAVTSKSENQAPNMSGTISGPG